MGLWILIDHLVWSVLTRSSGCASSGSLDDLLLGCQHMSYMAAEQKQHPAAHATPVCHSASLQRLMGTGLLQTACSTGDTTHRRTISKVQRRILCWVVSWKSYIEEHQHSQKHLVQMILSEKSHLQILPACLQHAYLFVSFQRCVSLCLEILLWHCWLNNTCRTDFVTLRWSIFPQQPGSEGQVRKKGSCFLSWPAASSASSGLQCDCVAEKQDGAQVHTAHADPSPVCAKQLLIESVCQMWFTLGLSQLCPGSIWNTSFVKACPQPGPSVCHSWEE